jgi:ABC-type branched-subunit amino acid transport system substrate-binding protein
VRHSVKVVAAGAISIAVVAGTSAFAVGAATPRGAPGVTATKVNVGAIVTQSGPIAADFKPYLSGVNAYFDYVNKELGGVNGRQIDLAYALDDGSNPQTDITDAHTLVTADHAFAIVGVSTPFFNAHKYLSTTPTPVFGYATGNVWAGPKNFFADYGSVLNFNSSVPFFAYVAKQTKSTNAAVIALQYPSSQNECKGALAGLKKYKIKIAYSNINESIGANWSIEATKMRSANVNMVVNCMDVDSDIALSKALSNYGLHPTQLWLDGYDRTILAANASVMQNVYLLLQHVPFEAAADYPMSFPGLNLYLTEMNKYGFSSDQYDDVALMGWESANLFTEGLRAAGKNPTQKAVTNAINKITKDTGGPDGGVTAPIDWKTAHTTNTEPACETFVKTSGSSFVLAFNRGAHPWVCFPYTGTANLNKPVKPPAGTPGA